MTDSLITPGDVLEGQGVLLQNGRLIADVDYHLTIPHQSHFFINPTGNFHLNYNNYVSGFILLQPADADKLSLAEYTLALVNKHKRTIRVERRYKEIQHKGEPRVSFWVKVIH